MPPLPRLQLSCLQSARARGPPIPHSHIHVSGQWRHTTPCLRHTAPTPPHLWLAALTSHRKLSTLVRNDGASSQNSHSLPPAVYNPPATGILSLLPASWVPYAELTRIDKPTGTVYLLLPTLWSTLMAASLTAPAAPVSSVLYTGFLFTSGALVMRGAGCTINDLWDRNIDGKVARTRLRPLARRAVTPRNAILFTGAQLLAGLAVLVQFPAEVIVSAIPSLLVVTSYPAMKRYTDYPQVVLGLAFSWGAMLGFPALGLSLLEPTVAAAAACLYASNVAWTVLYDTVYAHQDIRDDKRAGVRSTAIANEGRTRTFLGGMGALQVSLLAAAGCISGMGPAYFVGSCGGTALLTAWMVARADIGKVEDCWWWFKWCSWTVGGVAIGGGLAVEYALRKVGEDGAEAEAAAVGQ